MEFTKLMQAQFDKMCATGKLFRSLLSGQEVWNIYINGFEKEYNPTFRDPESSTHNCNTCHSFIRRYGNIVAVDEEYNIMTIFDIEGAPEEYVRPAQLISAALKSAGIGSVFFETFDELKSLPYESCSKSSERFKLGVDKNVKMYTKEEADKFGVVTEGEVRVFEHLHLYLPKAFVNMTGRSVESIEGDYRSAKEVFARGMNEIPLDTLSLVKDLIIQRSLLDGETHLYKVEKIIPLKEAYDKLPSDKRDNWCWVTSYNLPMAKFRNELIGVLCTELAEGKELNDACQSWNKRVDPANYMKAVAPITKKQIEEAKKFVEENGYEESFDRRLATIDDIKASEILHLNIGEGKIKSVSIFDGVRSSTPTRHKRSEFDGVEEVTIEKFMKDILPTCTNVEAFLSPAHERNLVTLTTSNVKDSKPIFKWSNNYSWTFNGNLAGKSQIKEAVKSFGGKVNGVLRFSIMWAEKDGDQSDLDAHCIEPNRNEIYYANRDSRHTGGNLDVDIIHPPSSGAVENITYPTIDTMPDGTYNFFVHPFSPRSSKGFKAEVEFAGESYQYEYSKRVESNVTVATVTLNKGMFTINHKLEPVTSTSKEVYGLQTNEFHKVNLVCLSPNHWEDNNVGNKHYFFMLEGCKCPTSIRSFHAENLIPELATHRKVLEVLGNTTMINPSDDKQLSGLGFNATVSDELIVRVQGSHKRVLKIKF